MDAQVKFVFWSMRVIVLSQIWMLTLALLLDRFSNREILVFVVGSMGIAASVDWYVRKRILG